MSVGVGSDLLQNRSVQGLLLPPVSLKTLWCWTTFTEILLNSREAQRALTNRSKPTSGTLLLTYQKNHRGTSDQGYGRGQFAFIPAAVGPG